MKSIIHEVMGQHSRYRRNTQDEKHDPDPNSGPDPESTPDRGQDARINIGNCDRLFMWQQEIFDTLRKGNDVFIVSNPGAGKTSPLMCYWQERIQLTGQIGTEYAAERFTELIQSPENFPKTLYLCPIRKLADQIHTEFIDNFAQIFTDIWFAFTYFGFYIGNSSSRQYINHWSNIISSKTRADELSSVMNAHITNLRNNQPSSWQKSVPRENTDIYNAFVSIFSQFIRDHLVNLVTGAQGGGGADKYPVSVSIIESGPKLYDQAKGKFRIIALDEAHFFQKYAEDPTDNRAYSVTEATYNILNKMSKSGQPTRFVMITGTINPKGASKLTKYINSCFDRRLTIKPSQSLQPSGNVSTIQVSEMDSLKNDRTLVNLVAKPRTNGNLIILFSKKRIQSITEQVLSQKGHKTSSSIERGSLNRETPGYGKPSTYMGAQESGRQSMSGSISSPGSSDKIHDELQRQAVSAGFGFIYRYDERQYSRDQLQRFEQDKAIVADLFSRGKIQTLLVTDAAGVGLNIKAKNLYLPQVEKRTSRGTHEKLRKAEGSQLLNRVGRDVKIAGVIYTQREYVDDVISYLNASPKDYEIKTDVSHPGQILCSFKMFGQKILSSFED